MRVRWGLLLVPPVIVSCGLLFVTQVVFLRYSFFKDLRLGRFEEGVQLTNYLEFFRDPFYLWSLKLTVNVGLAVAAAALLFGYPVAYVLARMNPRWSTRLLASSVPMGPSTRHFAH
jgi:putative spermidine/putrescine transport system permease protein